MRPARSPPSSPRWSLDPQAPEAQRRAALARWIADPANPLPARVMVNRVWHYHFGRGIVATPSDFGFNGAPPSHPELLDWLASTYIAGGWRLKPIHRLIVTSAAYRQSSRLDDKAQAVDRDNRLLWRMTPRRLEAESIRDAILAVERPARHPDGRPRLQHLGEEHATTWRSTSPAPSWARTRSGGWSTSSSRAASPTRRSVPSTAPTRPWSAPRRNVSTTALQALNLLNSRFVIQQATFSPSVSRPKPAPTRPARPSAGFAWRSAARRHPPSAAPPLP